MGGVRWHPIFTREKGFSKEVVTSTLATDYLNVYCKFSLYVYKTRISAGKS